MHLDTTQGLAILLAASLSLGGAILARRFLRLHTAYNSPTMIVARHGAGTLCILAAPTLLALTFQWDARAIALAWAFALITGIAVPLLDELPDRAIHTADWGGLGQNGRLRHDILHNLEDAQALVQDLRDGHEHLQRLLREKEVEAAMVLLKIADVRNLEQTCSSQTLRRRALEYLESIEREGA